MLSDAYVIVGAGHAARRAAETLRERAPDIRIVMIGDEAELPYDRPVLSKDALLGEHGERRAFIRDAGWYHEQRIEMRLGIRVERIDRSTNCVIFDDGSRIEYHRLLLATGSQVRRFSGSVDKRLKPHYLRTIADARALRKVLLPKARVAIIGGGFVGLEVAASAVLCGCTVTVIEPASRLLQRSMPAEISAFMLRSHQRRGVDVQLGTTPLAIHATSTGVATIITDHGDIPADVVVIGIGVIPNVELAAAAGLVIDNGIVVDQHCRTADPKIFAAGEVTNHYNPLTEGCSRIESWQVAEYQPLVAAANMLGDNATYEEIPWLWSDQYDCNLQALGHFAAKQTVVVRGDQDEGPLCVMALGADGCLEAAVTVNGGQDMAVCRRLIMARKILDGRALGDLDVPLRRFLK